MSQQPPGWYDDPGGSVDAKRWWDGTTWTSWLSSDEAAPAPEAPTPDALVPDRPQGEQDAPVPARATATGPRVSRLTAVLVVAAAVLVGVLVTGVVVWASTPRLPTGPALPPPPADAPVTKVDYSATARTAEIDEARMTLPSLPYRCDPGPGAKPPQFESLITCNALVHENYNPEGDDWYASVGFGVPAPSMVVAGDLTATTDRVFDQLRGEFFLGQQTTVEQRKGQVLELGGRGAQTAYGNVTYRIDGLSSSYDRVLVIVVELASGDFAVAYSVRPDDLPQATRDVLDESLNSVTAR